MKKLTLNTEKIRQEMVRLKVNNTWLAKRLNATPAMVTYIFKNKPITFADRLGKIFGIEPRDLIK